MANIFNALAEFVNKPNRNTFDLSFQNNLTMNFGTLYPVFCKEVIPGDSFRIRPTFGLRFMPLVFPIQTRMQANLHFFYVRNRNLWKDWPDFIGNTKKDLIPPYISTEHAQDIFRTGSIGDYLGVPTTFAGSYGVRFEQSVNDFWRKGVFTSVTAPTIRVSGDIPSHSFVEANATFDDFDVYTAQARNFGNIRSNMSHAMISAPFDITALKKLDETEFPDGVIPFDVSVRPRFIADLLDGHTNVNCIAFLMIEKHSEWRVVASSVVGGDQILSTLVNPGAFLQSPTKEWGLRQSLTDSLITVRFNLGFNDLQYVNDDVSVFSEDQEETLNAIIDLFRTHYGTTIYRFGFAFVSGELRADGNIEVSPDWSTSFGTHHVYQGDSVYRYAYLTADYRQLGTGEVLDINSILPNLNPFLTGDLRISALPFRAYESIYNAFYRNQFNDPFMIDGQKEFNKFLRNTDGGADTLNYELFNRNWELDFLTSARQSPVDGDITPLVGVTGTGKFVFKNEDDTTYTVTPIIGEDGHTLTGIDSIQGTPENNSGIRRLIDMASVGISINDFRNVNALQRWLETNLRRGYRYRDQIMSHFGVNVRYEELDMPEFIGGMSEPVMVNQVNQMSDQTGDPSGLGDFSKVLGSFAGQASILAQSRHEITKYCDEHGFIIGILSVSPVPNYSQLLPKHFIKNSVLDYYFPTFGHIGNQPITYREVCPLQSYAAGDSLDDVFGYQRAWYDYIASVDETHGDFRTSLEGFLINRVFSSRPELGKDFITIDKDSMSNPFSVTDDTDKILGEVYFDVMAQRPIPKLGIPRLE